MLHKPRTLNHLLWFPAMLDDYPSALVILEASLKGNKLTPLSNNYGRFAIGSKRERVPILQLESTNNCEQVRCLPATLHYWTSFARKSQHRTQCFFFSRYRKAST